MTLVSTGKWYDAAIITCGNQKAQAYEYANSGEQGETSLVEFIRANDCRIIFIFIFMSRHYSDWLVVVGANNECVPDYVTWRVHRFATKSFCVISVAYRTTLKAFLFLHSSFGHEKTNRHHNKAKNFAAFPLFILTSSTSSSIFRSGTMSEIR